MPRTIEAVVRKPSYMAALALVALGGCYYDNEEELYPFSFCDTQGVSWAQDIQPLIQLRCATPGCHVPGAQSPDLTTYAAVKAQADAGRIQARVIDRVPSSMPPTGPLPSCDQLKIKRWLEEGSPDN